MRCPKCQTKLISENSTCSLCHHVVTQEEVDAFARLTPLQRNSSLIGAVITVILIICMIGAYMYEVKKDRMISAPSAVTAPTMQSPTAPAPAPTLSTHAAMPYTVAYTLSKHRYDGAITLLLLVDAIDLSNDYFKGATKATVSELVAKHGRQVSISIIDNHDALELYRRYEYYEGAPPDHLASTSERKTMDDHLVAAFDGEMKTGPFLNTLMFYPGHFTSDAVYGPYVETVEFSP